MLPKIRDSPNISPKVRNNTNSRCVKFQITGYEKTNMSIKLSYAYAVSVCNGAQVMQSARFKFQVASTTE